MPESQRDKLFLWTCHKDKTLNYQLVTLLSMATLAGCYDAADWLKDRMKD